jgi:hypothetical protein
MIRKLGLAGFAAVLVLAVAAGTASAQTLRGTVVHRNARAHSFVVANSKGALSAVHARKTFKTGRVVRVSAVRLRNGTFSLRTAHVLGRTRHARIRGTVTFVKRGAYVVSAPGTSLLVKDNSPSQTPSVGDQVQVNGTIDDQGDIEEQDVQQIGTDNGNMELEGVVLGVDQQARTLSISADDDNESGSALTVDVPQSFDITQFTTGQEVELSVTPNGDGTFTLAASSDDDNANDANDQNKQQGDDDQSDQGDQHDGSGQDDDGSQQTSGGSGSSSDD